jgi:hypothetical protein
MPSMSARRLAAGLAVTVLLFAWMRGGDAPSPVAPVHATQPGESAKPVKLYIGNSTCGGAACHGSAKPAAQGEEKLDGFSTCFARHNELHQWEALDKHRIATRVLTGPLGKQIAGRMGIKGDLTDPHSNQQWRQCLSCHGVVIDDEKWVDPDTFSPKDRVDSGVSCLVCHGPYADWVNEHSKRVLNRWKTFRREEKEEKFGLRDLWDPVKRASLCCSCHVGAATEGKVVTHEMYAAGHPPLPGFEMVTFSDAMPRHWETLSEKEKRLPQFKELYAKAYHFDEDTGQRQVRLLLTSALMSLRQSAQLIAEYARPVKQGAERDWPEFALYDCYACHHELKADSWRQKRGYAGKPGRPQMRDWPLALIPLAVRQEPAGIAGDFPMKLAALQTAFSNVPFGDPVDVLPQAKSLVEWSDAMLKQMQQARFARGDAGKLLDVLMRGNESTVYDFDSARQVGWAMQVLLAEAHPDGFKEASAKEPLTRLQEQLKLALPRGPQPLVDEYAPATMAKRADYDAFEFQRNFKAIAALLPKK